MPATRVMDINSVNWLSRERIPVEDISSGLTRSPSQNHSMRGDGIVVFTSQFDVRPARSRPRTPHAGSEPCDYRP